MTAVKIVKVLGTSDESWEDAAEEAARTANEPIDGIRGIEVEHWTAAVEDGDVVEYRATVEVSFPVREKHRLPAGAVALGGRE
jgi:flavin-binding protein dodecin